MGRMKTVGYIVRCTLSPEEREPQPMEISTNPEDGNRQLYFGDTVTLFDTYEQARAAIRRTVRAYNAHAFPDGRRWDFHKEFGRPSIMRATKPE